MNRSCLLGRIDIQKLRDSGATKEGRAVLDMVFIKTLVAKKNLLKVSFFLAWFIRSVDEGLFWRSNCEAHHELLINKIRISE